DQRQEFGHFELDTVVGKRNGQESVILTLIERQSRCQILRLIDGRDADSVNYELAKICQEYGSIMKSVTADNGAEFSEVGAVLRTCLDTLTFDLILVKLDQKQEFLIHEKLCTPL
uniref:IS30 family transposase n=1 Tax=Lactiplantibacillus plantarum TaxID=1590 RepID=UPI0021CB1E78